MISSEKWKWIAAFALLSAAGWAFLFSPWAEWAPAGAKWPSLLVAFLFGLTAFLAISYYPLILVAALVSVAFGFSRSGRIILGKPFFQEGLVFLIGFASAFGLQLMAILRANAHGAGGGLFLDRSGGGLFVLAALVSVFLSSRRNLGPAGERTVYGIPLYGLILLLGLGWGAYYGHELDPAYDRTFFRIGAGPGSHEAPALVLFGLGLLGLHVLWAWGGELWLGEVIAQRKVRLGAGTALALLGLLMMAGFHPF